jgi:hypothetical protein
MAKFRGAVKVCENCGREFKVPPSRANTARFCSSRCSIPLRMDGLKKRVTLRCPNCGQEFEAPECHAHRRKYCSVACREGSPSIRRFRSISVRGARNGAWVGGRVPHTDGYVYVRAPDHPLASNGYVLEHRLVMEDWLKANAPESEYLVPYFGTLVLSPAIHVHHRDEDRGNNAIENLVCMTPAEHQTHHRAERAKRQA